MLPIIKKIPTMSEAELINLFSNAINWLDKKDKDAPARAVLEAIAQEWKNRLTLARANKYHVTAPDIGMLATLGYYVGSTKGEKPGIKRKILTYVMEGELPFVNLPAYTDEWGPPKSPKRYTKLIHFFDGHLNNKAHTENA